MRNDIITGEFARALRDYAFLLNREYPRKSILKIVGDRYLLNTFQRILLSRGIFPEADVQARQGKTASRVGGKELYIDAYNVLFTICNYLLGRMVFVSNDRFVRDTGEVYGKPHDDPVFRRGIEMCFSYLKKQKPARVEFLLDSPVSKSAELAGLLRDMITEHGLEGDAQIDKNPDAWLIRREDGTIVSSDSDILDNTELQVLDLAQLVLRDNFELQLPDLGLLLNREG
jgi:hypothetical protein